jgi:hypothetical protein
VGYELVEIVPGWFLTFVWYFNQDTDMTPTTALLVARDLAGAADKVRDRDPDVAAGLDHDRELLLDSADPLTVTATAELLGQSRLTIHDWLKRGLLDAHSSGSKGKVLIDPRCVATLLPFIDEWRDAGGTKRVLGVIIARLEEAETAQLLTHAENDEQGRPVIHKGAVGFGVSTD